MKLGFIGLGRMGSRMVMKLLSEGHEVVVWNRSKEKIENLKNEAKTDWKLFFAETIPELADKLEKPRIIWSMLPAGDATEEILMAPGAIAEFVEEGDIVIDGGNAFFEDTQRRYEYFTDKKVQFLGIGVSGGLVAFDEGYPLMIGGSQEAYDRIKLILDSLAKPNGGHEYFGEGGAGHFVKMVHNGIEYGYMQAIGEGFGVLEKAPYEFDLEKVAKLYTKGTLLSGFMMDRVVEAFEKDPKLADIEGYVEASGEGEWTVNQANKENVPVPVIEQSLEYRTKSRQDPQTASSFAARMVAALRNAFGGHEVKKKD